MTPPNTTWQEGKEPFVSRFNTKFPYFSRHTVDGFPSHKDIKDFIRQELQQARAEGQKEGILMQAGDCSLHCEKVRKEAIEEAIDELQAYSPYPNQTIKELQRRLHSLITPTN